MLHLQRCLSAGCLEAQGAGDRLGGRLELDDCRSRFVQMRSAVALRAGNGGWQVVVVAASETRRGRVLLVCLERTCHVA